MRNIQIFLFITFFFCCCNNASKESKQKSDLVSINKMYERYYDAVMSSDPSEFANTFAIQGVLIPHSNILIKGHNSILKWAQKFLDNYSFEGAPSTIDVKIDGVTAHKYWKRLCIYTSKSKNNVTKYNQEFLDILHKENDGTWKIAYQLWLKNDSCYKGSTKTQLSQRYKLIILFQLLLICVILITLIINIKKRKNEYTKLDREYRQLLLSKAADENRIKVFAKRIETLEREIRHRRRETN
ncbi:MAG: hypothetical protein GF353_23900 [Candidatus Lokiarchaeota archaeon]|nr:hypothetical protein [Candidatus Lokiarchaeota archaeon]